VVSSEVLLFVQEQVAGSNAAAFADLDTMKGEAWCKLCSAYSKRNGGGVDKTFSLKSNAWATNAKKHFCNSNGAPCSDHQKALDWQEKIDAKEMEAARREKRTKHGNDSNANGHKKQMTQAPLSFGK
jgi:hypothetical protein